MDDEPYASRVAIPRLRRPEYDLNLVQSEVKIPKVQIACNNCRSRKLKCSGEQPHCQNCSAQSVSCTYSQTRKDRLKDATEHISQLVALLKDLGANVDDVGQQKINQLLDSLEQDALKPSVAISTMGEESQKKLSPSEESQDANTEADVSGSVGSNNHLDLIDEDLFRSRESRATGFVGQNSEIQWFRSLKTKLASPDIAGPVKRLPYGPPGSSNEATALRAEASHARQQSCNLGRTLRVSGSTFYLDGDDLEVDVKVDPYELPSPEMAKVLFEYYTRTVHTSFPILPDTFGAQFRRYIESVERGRPYQVIETWQAKLNLVFAIGARYSHLAQIEWRSDERDHLVYMTRAVRILQLDKILTNFSAPTMSLIQATGLLSLYYLTIGRVSRAWMTIGMSIRFALAVGLHLRNEDSSTSSSKRESLVQAWWSLYSIENLLCTLIGRPCMISRDQCTVSLPPVVPRREPRDSALAELRNLNYQDSKGSLPTMNSYFSRIDPETVTRGSYLGARVIIDIIVQKALSRLYSPQTSVDSWKQIQEKIDALSMELDEWVAAALPGGLEPVNSIQESGIQRERLLLSFQYHSAKLLIYRPCLCRLERRIMRQSGASANFSQKAAEACVQAAQAVTRLLPDQPDLTFVYQQSPWWCIVHNIMQAMAVFLLEMSFNQTHMAHPDERILVSIRKLIRWLQSISVSNAIAQRAYKVVVDIINTGAPRLRVDISDILAEGNDQNHSFQGYQSPRSSAFQPHFGGSFPVAERRIPSSGDPTATADFGTQYSAVPGQQQRAEGLGGFQPDQHFMSDPQMPSIFGNPFITTFDLANPLQGQFFQDGDVTIDNLQAELFPKSTV